MGDFDACRFDFRLDAKNGLMPSKRRKTERIQPSNYSTLFKCKICGTLFACRMLLLEHKLTHTEYRYNRCKYECGLCTSDRRFSRKDHLRDHLTREHQLDPVKVAEVTGDGRLKQHAAARKSRGSAAQNRKSSAAAAADGSFRRGSVVKRTSKNSTAKEEDDDDVRDASQVAANDVIGTTTECGAALGAAFLSNSVTSASPQTQTTCGEKILPPNYLYINFPILITPTTTTTTATTSKSNDSTTTTTRLRHHHSMIQGDDLAQRIKVEIDDQMTSQPVVVTSSQPGNVFDLPMALSRFLAYNNYVTSLRDDVADERKYGIPATSGDVTPFDFFASAIKQDLGHLEDHRGHSTESGTMIDLGNDLGNDLGDGGLSEEETALDFSLKTSGHLACYDQGNTYENPSLNHHNDAGNQSELDDVVDLSRKKWLSDITAHNPDREDDVRRDDDNRMGKWSAPWNIGNLPSSSKAILSPADTAKPSGPIGSTGSKVSLIRSQVIGQVSMSRGKSVLNRTVEKLWKNKIGLISNLAEARSLETECDSLDFARGNRDARNSLEMKSVENKGSARPWNLSAESPTTKTERFRGLDAEPVSLLQPISVVGDEDDYDQLYHHHQQQQQHKRENHACKSAADEDKDETRTEEDSIVDLTTSFLSRNITAAESDGIVSPSPAERNLSPKDLSSLRLPYRVSGLDSLPFSQSEQLFNQIMRDLELTAILKSSPDDSPVENNCPSVLWTSNSKDSGDVQEVDDAVSMLDGHRPESSSSLASSPIADRIAARQRRPDHRLNCGYPQCSKTFKEWRHLKVHLTLHTGEKPLSCYLCKYTCRHRSSMNWHMKSKHRMEKSKVHGNRTVYVDSAAAAAAPELVVDDDDSSHPEPETGFSQFPETDRENCDGFATAPAEENKESVFLNTLRNNLSLLANGLNSNATQQNVMHGTGRGGREDDVLTDSSTGVTEDTRLKEDDVELALKLNVDDRHGDREVRRVTEVLQENSLPQLLLKKVTASPGKDPKYYTSLMRFKYVKHPSTKFHGHRQPQRRRPSAAKRNETASDVTEAKRETAPSCECARCGVTADNQAELRSHVLATHGKEMHELRDNLCSTCGKSDSRISQHHHRLLLLGHKTDVTTQCACPVANCSQQFVGKGRHHLRLLHPGELTKPPTDAAETGVDLQDQAEQARSSTPSPTPVGVPTSLPVQTDERPVTCDYPGCDKSFRELKHLKVHHLQHTDEKPLRCHVCDYSCRQRNSLNWHMKSKHGLEKHVTNDGRTVYI